jgi:hypothetical protein
MRGANSSKNRHRIRPILIGLGCLLVIGAVVIWMLGHFGKEVFIFKNNQRDQLAEYRVLKNSNSVLVLSVHQADDAVSTKFKDRFFGSLQLGVDGGSKPQPAQPPVE